MALIVAAVILGFANRTAAAPFDFVQGPADAFDTMGIDKANGTPGSLTLNPHFAVTRTPGGFFDAFSQFGVLFDFDATGTLSDVQIGAFGGVPLNEYISDPVFTQAAIVTLLGGFPSLFRMPALAATSISIDPLTQSGSVQFGAGVLGYGMFASFDSCPSAGGCRLDATFTSATLQVENGLATRFFGDAIFNGSLYLITGGVFDTEGPAAGSFSYNILPSRLIAAGGTEGDSGYAAAAVGTIRFETTPVPEPATVLLVGFGAAVNAARACRSFSSRGRRKPRT